MNWHCARGQLTASLIPWTFRWISASSLVVTWQVYLTTCSGVLIEFQFCFEKIHGQNRVFAPQSFQQEHFKRHFEDPFIQNRFSCSTSFTCCSCFSDIILVDGASPLARDRQGIDSLQAFIAYLFIIIINWVLRPLPRMLLVILHLSLSRLPTTAFGLQPCFDLD